jgi:hypothetical protein
MNNLSFYFDEMKLAHSLQETVNRIKAAAEFICPEPIKDIFISNYRKTDNSIDYESVWFFSDTFCLEAVGIYADDFSIDITPISAMRLYYAPTNFDLVTAPTDLSTLSIECSMVGADGSFKAVGKNCSILLNIIKKYFLTKLNC